MPHSSSSSFGTTVELNSSSTPPLVSPLTPPPPPPPHRIDIHARYSSSVLSSPTTPRTPRARSTQSIYAPFTPSRGKEDGAIGLTQVQPIHSPFHDSMVWQMQYLDDEGYVRGVAREQAGGDTDSGPPRRRALLSALGYGDEEPSQEFRPKVLSYPDPPPTETPKSTKPSWTPPSPSVRLLFSLCKREDLIFHVLPCVILAATSSLITPYMTMVIGDAFDVFSAFPLDIRELQPGQGSQFVKEISSDALKLTITGLIGLGLNLALVSWWICVGEKIVDVVRGRVYGSVMGRSMAWFDLGMGMRGQGEEGQKEEAVGAGGLMGKFASETDEVRIACGRVMGLSVQSFCTFLSCLLLALIKSWSLALVTLSAVPLVVIVSIVTNLLVNPLYTVERRALAEAATDIERTTNMIGTVKAFNAQRIEIDRFNTAVQRAKKSMTTQSLVWGISNGLSNFVLMAMFVLGFWYGGKLIRAGKANVADVMTVFWACLLASSNLEQLIPQLVYIQKGKTSMASLMTIVLQPDDVIIRGGNNASHERNDSKSSSLFGDNVSPTSATTIIPSHSISKRAKKTVSLQRIRPAKTIGEFAFHNVSFAYPSRPGILALSNVTLFLPAGEMTFIVGSSGSGKSTVAQLLLRLYEPDAGEVLLDDRDLSYLDIDYTREVVSAVQQGCIMFDASVHDNVAMGLAGSETRNPQDATREEIISACEMAMIDEFIRDLPDGYDTNLGNKGANLSGGQKQRLAIARARLRDPSILILDEATSALDVTSRIAVFEAIKTWRRNRTTIVITHDLAQIGSQDFVYVMKQGQVVEQGFRGDLITLEGSEFGKMASLQAVSPLPVDQEERWRGAEDVEEVLDGMDGVNGFSDITHERPSSRMTMRPASIGYLAYMDILAEYATRDSFVLPATRASKRLTMGAGGIPVTMLTRPASTSPKGKSNLLPSSRRSKADGRTRSRLSDLITPVRSSLATHRLSYLTTTPPEAGPESQRDAFKHLRPVSWVDQPLYRKSMAVSQYPDPSGEGLDIKVVRADGQEPEFLPRKRHFQSATRLILHLFPGVPKKFMMVAGVIFSIGHGVMTPFWSKYIAELMAEVSTGGLDSRAMAVTAGSVLAISAADALSITGQYYFLDYLSVNWATVLRVKAFKMMVRQPQTWFDQRENAASRMDQTLIKDAEDMRPLMSVVIGKSVTIVVMLSVGLSWAMAIGWRVTLVGLAVGPFFALAIMIGSYFIDKMEAGNKMAREDLSRMFYETLANVRSIRAMSMEKTFQAKFEEGKVVAWQSGRLAAVASGSSHGITVALPYFAQALLIWVSALFMVKGYYNYAQILQIYSLILFTVTWAAQIMDFIPAIAKSRMAASDFDRLRTLPEMSDELKGELRFPISGQVTFQKVTFAYPTRPDVPILRGLDLQLKAGECVAIVGPSGSGKSTIAALLQRLYEPSSGQITLDRYKLAQGDIRWLRDHIAIVSQTANLFDGTVEENIAYGSADVPVGEVERAARAANVHDFIMSLPNGYQTNLGENASLISGGQAQRLQIARALVKRSSIMILDECTSALDPENQQAILDTIMKVKQMRTTIFVTHKADVMRRCDRVLCMADGRIAEEGAYDELVARRGVFARLMQSGEWQ